MEKVIITVAPTGNGATRKDTPHVPMTPREIAEDICACCEAGAAIAHIHAKTADGKATLSPEIYRQIISIIKDEKKSPIVCQASLAGGSPELIDILDINPEMASLGMGTVNYATRINPFDPNFIVELARKMYQRHCVPELEVFDTGMVGMVNHLYEQGLLRKPLKINFILNLKWAAAGTPEQLTFMVKQLPPDAVWGITAWGDRHIALTTMAMAMGGHVRVGIEDTLYDQNGNLSSNVEQVKRMAELAKLIGREVATPAEARTMLGIGQ